MSLSAGSSPPGRGLRRGRPARRGSSSRGWGTCTACGRGRVCAARPRPVARRRSTRRTSGRCPACRSRLRDRSSASARRPRRSFPRKGLRETRRPSPIARPSPRRAPRCESRGRAGPRLGGRTRRSPRARRSEMSFATGGAEGFSSLHRRTRASLNARPRRPRRARPPADARSRSAAGAASRSTPPRVLNAHRELLAASDRAKRPTEGNFLYVCETENPLSS